MGRVTIFAADRCPHSAKTKAALEARSIPYTVISVTQYPEKRADMLSLSGRMSTPQVFFNTRHIGGTDETIALLDEWDTDKKRAPSALARYKDEIARFPEPSNSRFDIPTGPPTTPTPSLMRCRCEEYSVPWPSEGPRRGTIMTVREATELLQTILPSGNNIKGRTLYKKSFSGLHAVNAIQEYYDYQSLETAEQVFSDLVYRHNIIRPVSATEPCRLSNRLRNLKGKSGVKDKQINSLPSADSTTANDEDEFIPAPLDKLYRLQCFQTPEVLNSYRFWNERVDPNPMRLVAGLQNLVGHIEDAALDKTRGTVDMIKAAQHKAFSTFEEAICELQGVDLGPMDDRTKTVRLAFLLRSVGIKCKSVSF